MEPTTDALLAGPRGRRLCLALAQRADQREQRQRGLAFAIATAARRDDAPGRASVLISGRNGSDRHGSDRHGDGSEDPPPVTAADVARLIASAVVPPPSAQDLIEALGEAVDSAMYWQEPDDEDALAARPEVRVALAGVASVIAGSPHAAWWTAEPDLDAQYAVAFDGAPARAPAAEILREWRAAIAEEVARAEVERPADPSAPYSGAWWSKPPTRLTTTTRALPASGPVGLTLIEDGLGWTEARTIRIRPPAAPRIYAVDGPDAWARLCLDGIDVTAARRHDWFRATGRAGHWVLPDWTRIAQRYDAVHLTLAGYLATAGRAVAVGDAASVLAGWNPDETVWLRDVATEPASTQQWRRARPSDPWHPLTPG